MGVAWNLQELTSAVNGKLAVGSDGEGHHVATVGAAKSGIVVDVHGTVNKNCVDIGWSAGVVLKKPKLAHRDRDELNVEPCRLKGSVGVDGDGDGAVANV